MQNKDEGGPLTNSTNKNCNELIISVNSLRFFVSATLHMSILFTAITFVFFYYSFSSFKFAYIMLTSYFIAKLAICAICSASATYVINENGILLKYKILEIIASKLRLKQFERNIIPLERIRYIYAYDFMGIVSLINVNINSPVDGMNLFGKTIGYNLSPEEIQVEFESSTKLSSSIFPLFFGIGMNVKNTLYGINDVRSAKNALTYYKFSHTAT